MTEDNEEPPMTEDNEENYTTSRRVMSIDRQKIFERDNYQCQNYGTKYDEDSNILEIAHQTPIQQGGDPNDPDNLVTLCPNCHNKFDMGELGDRIALSIQRDSKARAQARNHASTVEAFAGDSIEITKMNILIASVAGTATTILIDSDIIGGVSSLSNPWIAIGGIAWILSTIAALWAYYSCRTSGASHTAIEEILDEDTDDNLSDETTKIYFINAKKIGASIGLTLLSVISFIGGIGLVIQ